MKKTSKSSDSDLSDGNPRLPIERKHKCTRCSLKTQKLILCNIQIVFISIVTILAQKWISTHENSPVVYITLLQIVVTYVNNILLLHKYSKRTIVSGSYGVYNQSESLVSCMLGWSIFNTLIHICSFAWWVYEEIQPGYCGGSSSFLDCIFIPNVCLPILAVSSILCIVCLIRMKIHFTNLARVTGSSLMEIQASSSVRQSKTAKPLPPTSRQSVNVPPNLSEETRRFSMQTKKNTLVTEYSSPYQESFSSLPQRPFSQ